MHIEQLFSIPLLRLPRFELSSTAASVIRYTAQYREQNLANHISRDLRVLDTYTALADLREFIVAEFRVFVREYLKLADVGVQLEQSWINFTLPGEHHHAHTHYNSHFSGVYYVDQDLNYLELNRDVTSGWSWGEDSPYRDHHLLTAQRGETVIFPSHIRHRVPTNTGLQTRTSISFNLTVRGSWGEPTNTITV